MKVSANLWIADHGEIEDGILSIRRSLFEICFGSMVLFLLVALIHNLPPAKDIDGQVTNNPTPL